ncbi:MAG TPA: RsmE family RNA methyltransferase [Vicinamibacterales bacterium]|nr:RsmE family RNA methyltransferase [Vicinamibacterales bacterium]HPW21099.1 RsmE family RNA methyltransferase [Vicinamibacterales bacterium]
MMPRLYVPSLAPGARTAALPPDEADHVRRVLRARVGSPVRVFDGRGAEREARVDSLEGRTVTVVLGDAVAPARECRVSVTLGVAVLKGEKTDAVVRDAVMMGVAALQPMLTDRSDLPPAAVARGTRLDRWRRIAVASAKQCGRAVVPEVFAPSSLPECLARHRRDAGVVLVEPSSEGLARARRPVPRAPASALVLVGPEGGWTRGEVDAAVASGCAAVTLGPRTLRADAVPVVALGVLWHYWGELIV